MAAQIGGNYWIGAGKSPSSVRRLYEGLGTIWDDTLGSATSFYANGIDKPPSQGVYANLGPGPHVLAGENLYIGVYVGTGATFDTTGGTDAYNFQIHQVNQDGSTEEVLIAASGSGTLQNTNVQLGGIAADPTYAANRHDPVTCFGPVPAGSDWTIYGNMRLILPTT